MRSVVVTVRFSHVVAVQDGQAAHDLMVAPGQAAQHGEGLALGVGLAHHQSRIAHHDRVGRR